METVTDLTSVAAAAATETGNSQDGQLSLSSQIIITEARKRNIKVTIIVPEKGLFTLQNGPNTVHCCSSLTERSSVVSAEICLDKYLTNAVLRQTHIHVPDQIEAGSSKKNNAFFNKYKRVVTKPPSQSMGRGVSVDIRSIEEMEETIRILRVSEDESVIIEEFVEGEDVRVVIIGHKYAAAIHRTPPAVTGNGTDSIETLIRAINITKPDDNQIPLNYETKRCVKLSNYKLTDVLPAGETIPVRKNANEHTGGVPEDVTDIVSPYIRGIAEEISRIINIPLIGIDFLVPKVDGDEYTVIEVNSRPGLDGHEPQPMGAKFIDFLFPETMN